MTTNLGSNDNLAIIMHTTVLNQILFELSMYEESIDNVLFAILRLFYL